MGKDDHLGVIVTVYKAVMRVGEQAPRQAASLATQLPGRQPPAADSDLQDFLETFNFNFNFNNEQAAYIMQHKAFAVFFPSVFFPFPPPLSGIDIMISSAAVVTSTPQQAAGPRTLKPDPAG